MALRIKPVLRKARETELVDLFRETGDYLRGLWVRLNGGGTRLREPPLSPELPLPVAAKLDTELVGAWACVHANRALKQAWLG